jgi:hypothetical protein
MVLRHKTPAEPAKPVLTKLAAATAELTRVGQHQRELVAQARSEGCTWEQVAAATGVSHHAARKRWHQVPATMSSDLQQAELAAQVGGSSYRTPIGGPNY